MQGKGKSAKKRINRDYSCWVFLANFKPVRRPGIWVGDKNDWVAHVKRFLHQDADLVHHMQLVAPPPGEKRLVLQANTKSTRAQFIGAIRRARCHIKAWPALTTEE